MPSCRQIFAIAFFIMCACYAAGCVSSDMMVVGEKTFPPRPDDYIIEVYASVDAPIQIQKQISNLEPLSSLPPNSKMIGRVDSNGASAASWTSVIDDAKKKAKDVGR